MKVGLHEDPTNRTKIAELMRYQTSKWGDRMKEGQNNTYYTTGEKMLINQFEIM